MKPQPTRRSLRCAIYTQVSTDQGLEQDFNLLDAQREASEAYVKSQAHEGWKQIRNRYDDGGFSGGSMDRPALRKLLSDVEAERIDVIVVYKVDRLTRSLAEQERPLDPDDAVPCVHLPRPGGSRDGGSPSARVLRQAPDRPADALVRAMARRRTAAADSSAGRTHLITPLP